MNLSRNEIITLKHLADGMQHSDTPEYMTDAQFASAALSLKSKGLIYAAVDYGEVVSAQIDFQGRAELDDRKSMEKRILRKLLRERYDLTEEQYLFLLDAKENGRTNHSSERDATGYKLVWGSLYKEKYLKPAYENGRNMNYFTISTKGLDLLEEISEEVVYQLSQSQSMDGSTSSEECDKLRTKLHRSEEEVTSLRDKILELKEQIALLENNKGNKAMYHYEKSKGVFDEVNLSLRERIVIMLAFFRCMHANKNMELSLGMKSLIGNKNTVTEYLRKLKSGSNAPLNDTEKENVRLVLGHEGIDTSYILDYLN